MSPDLFLIAIPRGEEGHWSLPPDISLATELPESSRWMELFKETFHDVLFDDSSGEVSAYKRDESDPHLWTWYVSVEPSQPNFQRVKGFYDDLFPLLDLLAEEIGTFNFFSGAGDEDVIFPRRLMEKTL